MRDRSLTVLRSVAFRVPRSSESGWSQRMMPIVWVLTFARDIAKRRLRMKARSVVMCSTEVA